jgi:hypothetical protein
MLYPLQCDHTWLLSMLNFVQQCCLLGSVVKNVDVSLWLQGQDFMALSPSAAMNAQQPDRQHMQGTSPRYTHQTCNFVAFKKLNRT